MNTIVVQCGLSVFDDPSIAAPEPLGEITIEQARGTDVNCLGKPVEVNGRTDGHTERYRSLQWRHNEHSASQITSFTVVYSTVYTCADQRKHQRSASLAFVRGIHRWPVNSSHKGPVTRKMFPFDDVIMCAWYVYIRFHICQDNV